MAHLATTITSLPAKSVAEYALPAAAQTHEIVALSDNLLLVSQQSDGSLVKVSLNDRGQVTGAHKYTPRNLWSGLHGLTRASSSTCNLPNVWVTLQFDNAVLLVNPNTNNINSAPQVLKSYPIPAPARGPHGIMEHNGNIWLACKDSSHIVRMSTADPNNHTIWPVSRRPIFVAAHPTSGDIYATLDASSKIWHHSGPDSKSGEELPVPADRGSSPVGLVAGADGNLWVTLIGTKSGGTGTFGRVFPNATFEWFSMISPLGAKAGLLHLAWGTDPDHLYLLGSSIVSPDGVDAVFTVRLDGTGGTANPRIAVQNTVMLPTQRSATHRVILHRGNLYVTELLTSTLALVNGAVVNGLSVSETWDDFGLYGEGVKADVVVYGQTC